jgi:hypothetical protein
MAELAMATGLARLNPTVLFQFLDDLPHLHEANLSRGCDSQRLAALRNPWLR